MCCVLAALTFAGAVDGCGAPSTYRIAPAAPAAHARTHTLLLDTPHPAGDLEAARVAVAQRTGAVSGRAEAPGCDADGYDRGGRALRRSGGEG